MHEHNHREEILRNIALGVAVETGESFFRSLVENLTKTLQVEYAFVGEVIEPTEDHIRVVAAYGNGQIMENFEYALAHTPCENVVGQQLCSYTHGVQQVFPQDQILSDLQIEAYIGTPLFDSRGRAFGLLVVMSCTRLQEPQNMEEVLKIYASRVNTELERIQTEEALRNSEERLQLALDGSGDGLWDWNITTGEVYLSPRWLTMLGYEENELPGHVSTWESLIHPDDKPWVMDILDGHLKDSEVPYAFDYRVRTKSGQWKWIANYGKVVARDHDGTPLRMAGTHKDISDRKQTEVQLNELTQRLILATDSAEIGIWDFDLVNNQLIWDQRMYELYGLDPGEFGGAYESWQRGVHPQDLPQAESDVQAAIAGERDFHTEFRVVWPDRQVRFIKAHAVVLRDAEGIAQRMIGVNWDITDRKCAEEQIQKYTAQLEASNQELEAFAYIASHDLQEPLRMVSSFTQLLAERYRSQLDETADQIIQFAVDGATRMQQLINDLLLYSRVGSIDNHFESIDCEAIVKTAITNLGSSIEESGAAIHYEGLPTILGDASQLLQLFQNLIGNAIKYRSEQPPMVWIGVEHQEDGYLFWVKDNGIGMKPKQAERIFQIFRRLHPQGKYNGTGIGLSICKKIIEQFEGKIWVKSELGQGSIFYFTIPQKYGEFA